jgi:hypothetical protein
MTDIPVTPSKLRSPIALAIARLEEQQKTQQYEYRTIAWDLNELKDAFLRHVHEGKVNEP